MDKLGEYSIAFKGLKEGLHEFVFELKDSFFECFESSPVSKGNLKAVVSFDKKSQMMTLNFDIKGEVGSVCDNCLDTLNLPIDYEGSIYVKFGEEYDEPTDEIVVLPQEEHEINVAQFFYEFIVVSLPLRHVHPLDEDGNSTCDPAMLEKLDQYLVDGERSEGDVDPRWNELKKLIDKNNK